MQVTFSPAPPKAQLRNTASYKLSIRELEFLRGREGPFLPWVAKHVCICICGGKQGIEEEEETVVHGH